MIPPTPAPLRIRPFLARLLIGLLLGILGLALYFSLNPEKLAAVLRAAPIPGSVAIPTPGPIPPLPLSAASPGPLPTGFLAYTGAFPGGTISCGFLLDLGGGRRVGVTAAHASPRLSPGVPAEFLDPYGARVAVLPGQIAFGQTFIGDQFTLDYVLWSVDPAVDPARFLSPDPRPSAQPGEPVYLYGTGVDGAGGPQRWPGVVLSTAALQSPNTLGAPDPPSGAPKGEWAGVPNAIWVQLEDSFSPNGYSGCPVVSRVTGRLLGMAVAGADLPLETGGAAVVIGLHPAASLVAKAQARLANP